MKCLKKLASVMMLSLSLTGCFDKKEEKDMSENSTLIPRKILFGNPEKTQLRLSYDGKNFAYIAPSEGVLNIFVAPVDDINKTKQVSFDKKRGIRGYAWALNSETIIFAQDNDGDENFALYSVNINTLEEKLLTPIDAKANLMQASKDFPDEILVGINDRNPEFFDVYKINIKTGEKVKVFENNEYSDFVTDHFLKLRFAVRNLPNGDVEYREFVSEKELVDFIIINFEDSRTSGIVGFDKSGKTVYMLDSKGRDTTALVSIDEKGNRQLIAENDKADIAEIMMHPVEKTIEAYGFEYEKLERVFFDKNIEAEFKFLQTVNDGEISVASRTLDDKTWVVAFQNDDGPVSYYKYDRDSKKADFLFYNKADLKNYKLAPMHPVVVKSRDGLNLVSYLTVPNEFAVSHDSYKTKQPVPLILYVHGGPTARDDWGYDPTHQWLANRGYAVVSINYRGSTGFGKNFITAGDGEWSRKMHDDLIDVAEWAIKEGITSKDKVAIMGGSYGGYAALVGVTFTPDFFTCGVSLVGPSNLVTLLNSIPPYWKPALVELIKKTGGDPATEEGQKELLARSPISFVDNIKKPLLIAQGANDPRVKQAESDQIVDAMKKKNIPVTYLLYPDEGHGFARPENRMSYYAVTEQFLNSCLGGKFEPIEGDFENSSIQIKESAMELKK